MQANQVIEKHIKFDGSNLEVVSQIGDTHWHIKYEDVIELPNCYNGILTYVTRNGIPDDEDGIGRRFMIFGLKEPNYTAPEPPKTYTISEW